MSENSYCTTCGGKLSRGENVCGTCGVPLALEPLPEVKDYQRFSEKTTKMTRGIVLGLILVFVLGVAIFTYFDATGPHPVDHSDDATAFTPCGKNPTPELAEQCQKEVQRTNDNYRRNAMEDYAQKLCESEGGRNCKMQESPLDHFDRSLHDAQ
jgi:hypothetical protein